MLVVILSFLTALLLVAGTYQASYSKSPWTKKSWFKFGTVSLSFLAGCLMITSAWRQDRSQQKLEAILAGVSQTVFVQDLELEFQGSYEFDVNKQGLLKDGHVVMSILPRTARDFCKWGVTHTPVEDSSVGGIFDRMDPMPSSEALVGFGDPSVQILKFELQMLVTNGSLRVVGAPTDAMPLVMTSTMGMDDYLQSQFIAVFITPGQIRGVEHAALKIKGKPVPLYFFEADGRWIASTVFRPTWERYCSR